MNKIEFGDCRETMRKWKEHGIKAQTCITSPPYYGLRDYGTAKWEGGDADCEHSISMPTKWNDPKRGTSVLRPETAHRGGSSTHCHKCGATRIDAQLGLEETPEEYIKAMVEVFRCVWDVLEDNGTLWLNIGDSYCNSNGFARASPEYQREGRNNMPANDRKLDKLHETGLKTKDLIGIPWMLAFALRADGWYLRQDIIWHKPNPMPESVQDRCTKAHEYIFLLSKSQKYYYDRMSIAEPAAYAEEHARKKTSWGNKKADAGVKANIEKYQVIGEENKTTLAGGMANKRSVWTVTTKPYAGAHFAVFPSDLIEPCILAGAPIGGIVLDPFMGSGTTAQVAKHLNRQYLGCELNLDYKPLQDKRLQQFVLDFV
jgi:DNA modification methylase